MGSGCSSRCRQGENTEENTARPCPRLVPSHHGSSSTGLNPKMGTLDLLSATIQPWQPWQCRGGAGATWVWRGTGPAAPADLQLPGGEQLREAGEWRGTKASGGGLGASRWMEIKHFIAPCLQHPPGQPPGTPALLWLCPSLGWGRMGIGTHFPWFWGAPLGMDRLPPCCAASSLRPAPQWKLPVPPPHPIPSHLRAM